jgi:hypothetical protein
MIARVFINKVVSRIAELFPDVTITYGYSEISATHFLKIVPVATYNSAAFMEMEASIYTDWSENGLDDEGFSILSDDSLVQLEDAEVLYTPAATEHHFIFQAAYTIEMEQFEVLSPASEAVWVEEEYFEIVACDNNIFVEGPFDEQNYKLAA